MTGQFRFKNLQHLVAIIKALKSVDSSISYTPILNRHKDPISKIFEHLLYKKNFLADVEYILQDMESNPKNFVQLIIYMSRWDDYMDTNSQVLQLILEYSFKNIRNMDEWLFNLQVVSLYMKTGNQKLMEHIVNNLDRYKYNDFPDEIMDIIVKRFDRDEYITKVTETGPYEYIILNDKMVKKYDSAVKRRIVNISAGFGYQDLPNLVIEAIIEEAVDTSGITAYKVDKIVDKFNIWRTDTTMRAGAQETNWPHFHDAQE